MFMTLVLTSLSAFGHGENKPGPHKGHIRMPGPFHTELVLESSVVKIYLLDMNFKNPTTLNSKVVLLLKEKTDEILCVDKESYFECPLPGQSTNYLGINVKAIRNGVVGKVVYYPLPLTFSKPVATSDDHSHHNH